MTKSRAQRAFAALQALNVVKAEREELLAAGIGPAYLSSLYPESEFTFTMDALMRHLDSVPDEELIRDKTSLRRGINYLADHYRKTMHNVGSAWELQRETTQGKLGSYLFERVRPHVKTIEKTEHASTLAQAVAWAWWSMSHRSELLYVDRRVADRLMLAVARHTCLPVR